MKISKRTLDSFELHAWGCANDNWNIANGKPTVAERNFLLRVHNSKYGCCGGDKLLTMKDIREYNESMVTA